MGVHLNNVDRIISTAAGGIRTRKGRTRLWRPRPGGVQVHRVFRFRHCRTVAGGGCISRPRSHASPSSSGRTATDRVGTGHAHAAIPIYPSVGSSVTESSRDKNPTFRIRLPRPVQSRAGDEQAERPARIPSRRSVSCAPFRSALAIFREGMYLSSSLRLRRGSTPAPVTSANLLAGNELRHGQEVQRTLLGRAASELVSLLFCRLFHLHVNRWPFSGTRFNDLDSPLLLEPP